jgi:hypothetical protein
VLEASQIPPELLGLLEDLQSVHDSSRPRLWKENLRGTAEFYNLNSDILDTCPDIV